MAQLTYYTCTCTISRDLLRVQVRLHCNEEKERYTLTKQHRNRILVYLCVCNMCTINTICIFKLFSNFTNMIVEFPSRYMYTSYHFKHLGMFKHNKSNYGGSNTFVYARTSCTYLHSTQYNPLHLIRDISYYETE